MKNHPFERGFDLLLVPKKLGEPLRWGKPRMVFVNSMSDLFHEGVPLSYIEKVAETMRLANWHTYHVLTKRSRRLWELLNGPLRTAAEDAHIWWGVSVEDRKTACRGSLTFKLRLRLCGSSRWNRFWKIWGSYH